MGRPSRKGLRCGRGSVARANTLEPDGDLPEVPKRKLIRGSAAQRRCGQMFSIERAKKPIGSRASHSLMDRWSPAPEILHHQQEFKKGGLAMEVGHERDWVKRERWISVDLGRKGAMLRDVRLRW
ncbi:hypothetical protein TIFTF001_037162 [Ficus carica]|uniref:Uncharacterized protein n=1 Tax=Ficus carica TaxID=3494 RepID=A0AA88E4S3_FICCA|nr:hypothetical protein TIFTF001_037159 [Ficus carica]GMN68105.1 hypothetical protein TIFTF001_037162 [Ficus carica]